MKIQRLSSKGFSHTIVLAAFVLVFAVAGVGYLVASHAASPCRARTFRAGSKGHCVRDVQGMLQLTTNGGLRVDGKFGSRTNNTVKKFQRSHHLGADGIVGRKTWSKLCTT